MEFSAQQIADFLKGDVIGDASVKVHNFSKIEEGKVGTLSFLSNPKYIQFLYETDASIVLVNKNFQPEKPVKATLICVDDAYQSLALLLSLVEQSKPRKTGISPLAHIEISASIGSDVYIAPFVYVGNNVTIGDNCSIYSNCCIEDNTKIGNNTTLFGNVTIYHECKIGNNCTLHAGVVIGSDGFGFAPTEDGTYKKIPQMGNVVLEDHVEIGANTVIDRATLGSTIIHKGVKLDNLVQIAHNVELGENTAIAAQSGVSGSTKIGKKCILGGQVGIAGHISLADGTIIGAQAGVANSIKDNNLIIQGSPAIPVLNFRKSSAVFKGLPELQKTVYTLKKQIEELENRINRIS